MSNHALAKNIGTAVGGVIGAGALALKLFPAAAAAVTAKIGISAALLAAITPWILIPAAILGTIGVFAVIVQVGQRWGVIPAIATYIGMQGLSELLNPATKIAMLPALAAIGGRVVGFGIGSLFSSRNDPPMQGIIAKKLRANLRRTADEMSLKPG